MLAGSMSQTSISPMLSVRRGAQAVEFYKQAFGARELFLLKSDSGDVVAQLAVGEAEFWVADESPENQNFSPESLTAEADEKIDGATPRGASTVRIVMVVEDPDAVFARALEAGAVTVWPVADQEYGWRVGRLVIRLGTTGRLASPSGDARARYLLGGCASTPNFLNHLAPPAAQFSRLMTNSAHSLCKPCVGADTSIA